MVSLAYRKRAIPIAWTWVRHVKGRSSVHRQVFLLKYVRGLVPKGIAVMLVGDCEFGSLTEREIYPVNLPIHWLVGEPEPWCLATHLPDRQLALQAYARRMWIEEMLDDLKRHGFDLESTMLRQVRRLSRLTLAVAVLYVWCLAIGTRTIRAGQRHLVDRKYRRDLSLFQIGLRFIERQLINALSIRIPLCYVLDTKLSCG